MVVVSRSKHGKYMQTKIFYILCELSGYSCLENGWFVLDSIELRSIKIRNWFPNMTLWSFYCVCQPIWWLSLNIDIASISTVAGATRLRRDHLQNFASWWNWTWWRSHFWLVWYSWWASICRVWLRTILVLIRRKGQLFGQVDRGCKKWEWFRCFRSRRTWLWLVVWW